MFNSCNVLTTIPSAWTGLESVTDTSDMFSETPISAIPTAWTGLENVTDASRMFNDCSFASVPSDWTPLANVTDTAEMLSDITELTSDIEPIYLYLSGKTPTVTSFTDMFAGSINATNYSNVPASWGGGGP